MDDNDELMYGVLYADGVIMKVPSAAHASWNLVPGAVIVTKNSDGEWVKMDDDQVHSR